MTKEEQAKMLTEAFGYIGDDLVEESELESLAEYASAEKNRKKSKLVGKFLRYSNRAAAVFCASAVGIAALLVVLMNVAVGGFGCSSSDKFADNQAPESVDKANGLLYSFAGNGEGYYVTDGYTYDREDGSTCTDQSAKIPWSDDLALCLTADRADDRSLCLEVKLLSEYLGLGELCVNIWTDAIEIYGTDEILTVKIPVIDDTAQESIRFTVPDTAYELRLEIKFVPRDKELLAEKLLYVSGYDRHLVDALNESGELLVAVSGVALADVPRR